MTELSDSDSDDNVPLAKKMKLLQAEKDDEAIKKKASVPEKEKMQNSSDKTDKIDKKMKKIEISKPSATPIVESDSSEEDVPLAQIVKKIQEKEMKAIIDSPKSSKVKKPAISKKAVSEKAELKKAELKKAEKIPKISAKCTQTSTESEETKKDEKENEKEKEDGDESSESDDEFKWWENPVWDDTIKWEKLEHSGVFFPPEYQAHGIKMLYDGREVSLEPEAEEVAGFFAALLETDYAKNPTFVTNFFDDFRATLERIKSRYYSIIKDFTKCDFTPMFRHFENLKIIKKAMTKEEKNKIKGEKKELDEEFGFCLLDGRKEKVGNYRIEPPGLFRGRGQHPKTGKLKTRVRPEDITINIDKNAKVPSPPPGHNWKDIVHNNTVTWLATWTENINGVPKYVQLGATSSLKGKSDYKKFETARRLKHHIGSIRSRNAEELRSKEMAVRQRATALWLIDHLAIRAGNEKGDDEADTVGCCSLRLEHVQLNPTESEVTFDFLGKDSIRYLNTVKVDAIIIKNLAIFMRSPKTQSDMIFDRLDTSMLNSYLTSLMPGLTAKVFRTYNASFTMQRELHTVQDQIDAPVAEKILSYNRANREVAILCNHQRAVAKSHDQSMTKLNEKIIQKTLRNPNLMISAWKKRLSKKLKPLKWKSTVKSVKRTGKKWILLLNHPPPVPPVIRLSARKLYKRRSPPSPFASRLPVTKPPIGKKTKPPPWVHQKLITLTLGSLQPGVNLTMSPLKGCLQRL